MLLIFKASAIFPTPSSPIILNYYTLENGDSRKENCTPKFNSVNLLFIFNASANLSAPSDPIMLNCNTLKWGLCA